MILFFTVFLLMGAGFVFIIAVKPLAQSLISKSWKEVPCEILSSEVKTHRGSKGYSVAISYAYRFEGREYRSNRYQFVGGSSSGQASKAKVVAKYRRGSETICFVNPKNPSEAVLDRGNDQFWFALIPFVFIGIGVFGITMALREGKSRADSFPEAMQAQPWLMRPDWRDGRIISSAKSAVRTTLTFAVLWNLITIPIAAVLFSGGKFQKSPVPLLVLIFPLAGVWLMVHAIRLMLRSIRFGESVFEVAQLPAPIGGALEGIIRPGKPVRLYDPAKVTISCVSRVTNHSSDGNSTSENILWQHEESVSPVEGGALPVALRIPQDASETTTLGIANGILWRLQGKASSSEGDYEASFEVPVFRVALSSEQEAKAQALLAREKVQRSTYVQPSTSRIQVEPTIGGGIEVGFPARRNFKATVLVPLAFAAAFVGPFLGLVFQKKTHEMVSWGIFGVLALIGLGIFSMAIYSLLASKRVIVQPEGVILTTDLLGIHFTRRIPSSDITAIAPKLGMQAGATLYQSLKVICHNGKEFSAGGLIADRQEAEWIASKMLQALGK